MSGTRRRRRAIFKWAATALLASLLTAWVLSGWCRGTVSYSRPGCFVTCGAEAGRAGLCVMRGMTLHPLNLSGELEFRDHIPTELELELGEGWTYPPATARWYWLGECDRLGRPPTTTYIVMVPFWAAALAVFIPCALMWRRDIRTAHRRRAGLCPTCGYDRNGLTPDALCPECGAAPPPARA